MSEQARRNIRDIIPYLSFLPTLYIVFAWGQSKATNDNHLNSGNIHIPYSVLVEKFVPRNEFKTMKEDVKEIKADVKAILLKDKNGTTGN